MNMIKEALMKQAANQLGEYADKGFKNLQDKLNRVNEQNDMIIDQLNEIMKGQIALWKALELVHNSDKMVFEKVQKELKIRMEVE